MKSASGPSSPSVQRASRPATPIARGCSATTPSGKKVTNAKSRVCQKQKMSSVPVADQIIR